MRQTTAITMAILSMLRYRALAVLLGVGIVWRFYALAVAPTFVPMHLDAIRYTRPLDQLFTDYWAPAGYPVFLGILRAVSAQLSFTIAFQHGLGVVTALLLYAAVTRVTGSRWPGLIPAAAVLLSGDQVYVEHSLLTESLLTVLVAAGCYCAVRASIDERATRWFILGGVALALASLVRSNSLALLPILALAALFSGERPATRFTNAAGVVVASLAIVGTYVGVATGLGDYSGLTNMGGWNLYARVAPFAQCTRFEEPYALADLCEERHPDDRPGPAFYALLPESPARRLFGGFEPNSGELRRFALTAIMNQPIQYGLAVARDLARYVDPSINSARPNSGVPPAFYSFGHRSPAVERNVSDAIAARYSGVSREWSSGVRLLTAVGSMSRFTGVLVVQAAVLAVLGLVLSRGPVRSGSLLFLAVAAVLYAAPVAAYSWDYRYGIPPAPFLVASAGIGGFAVLRRICQASEPQDLVESARPGNRLEHGAIGERADS